MHTNSSTRSTTHPTIVTGITDRPPARPTPAPPMRRGRRGERGEGVISTAIAVLIVAFLGVAMWAGFSAIFDDAADQTRTQVERIGR